MEKIKTKHKLLVCCTGSVASVKIPELLLELKNSFEVEIKLVATENALHFFKHDSTFELYRDKDEWEAWTSRGDPVLHIELRKWADSCLIAPLDANTLAKLANGICDNLLTCVLRAWDFGKPILICPAMNTQMYLHPFTSQHLTILENIGYRVIPPIEKKLICGDVGLGAMASIPTIVDTVKRILS